MSYKLTDIWLYGVTVSYAEALQILEHAGNIGFLNELENDFKSVSEDFYVDPFTMKMDYDDLQLGLSTNYSYNTFRTLADFFDYFGFCCYQVPPVDRDTIPTVYDERRGIQFHRFRYYVDLFCKDADSRGDSLRLEPGRETIYGVYIASHGYAYEDDVRAFDSNPRIEANFNRYCSPLLESLGLARTPQRVLISQTW